MVLMGNEALREALNCVHLVIDFACFLPVGRLQQRFPTSTIRFVLSKVLVPRDELIGLLLENTPRMEHLQAGVLLLVKRKARFQPAFLTSPQMSQRSVP